MNKEIKERWIEALESGKYPQGRGALRRTRPNASADEFCCLGVLCDIMEPEMWTGDGDGYWQHYIGYAGIPATVVLDEAELDYHDATELAALNDSTIDGPDNFRAVIARIKRL